MRILVIAEHEYWTRTLWLDRELHLMLPILDGYLTNVYDDDIEFRFNPPVNLGDYDFTLILTTGYLQHPAVAHRSSGWYDSTSRLAWVKISSPAWYQRFTAYWRLEPWRAFQGRISANISHEVSHIIASALRVRDPTHNHVNEFVYFDATGRRVDERGPWRFVFQRLR